MTTANNNNKFDSKLLIKVTFVHMVCTDCGETFGSLAVPYELHNKVDKVLAKTDTLCFCKKCTQTRVSESWGLHGE
jgi:hypothetical protein